MMKIGSARVLVLHASKYDFTPDGRSEKLTGMKLTYCSGGSEVKTDNVGAKPTTATLDIAEWSGLSAVPGWYDADMFMTTETVTKNGQKETMQVVKPGNLSYVEALRGPSATPTPSPKLPVTN